MKNIKLRHKIDGLATLLGVVYMGSASVYCIADGHSFWDSLWWAFMTFTTVGYGDQYPHSVIGRISGIILVLTAVFAVLPTITAVVVTKVIGNEHEFTHAEQEEIKALLREIVQNTRNNQGDK
jgi:voltage-gated potassium channel